MRPQRPSAVRLPSGITMPVDIVTAHRDGRLDLPSDVTRAGWWAGGSRLGDPFGAIVLAAHVDSFAQGIGPIAELLGEPVGGRVVLTSTRWQRSFGVLSTQLVARVSLAEVAAGFRTPGPLRLVLITCGGAYDTATQSYADNVVVTASPIGDLRRR